MPPKHKKEKRNENRNEKLLPLSLPWKAYKLNTIYCECWSGMPSSILPDFSHGCEQSLNTFAFKDLTQSKSKTTLTRSVHGKFSCITFNFDRTQHIIKLIHKFHYITIIIIHLICVTLYIWLQCIISLCGLLVTRCNMQCCYGRHFIG